jgi:hypothetical protein
MTVLFLSRLNRTVTSIYRDMNAGQEDAGGQTPPPDWELVATEVPCRATVTAAVEPVDAEKTVVVEDRRVALPLDTDVTEADQLGAITFEDGTVITEETAKGIVAGRWWESHSAAGLVSRVVTEPAKHDGVRIVGKVGTTHRYGFYGLFLEREQPFMRPVADETFPHLAERIRGF